MCGQAKESPSWDSNKISTSEPCIAASPAAASAKHLRRDRPKMVTVSGFKTNKFMGEMMGI